jgi:hypothetical protein
MQRLDNRPMRYKTIFTTLDSAVVRGALCVFVWATAVRESRAPETRMVTPIGLSAWAN